MVVRRSFVSLNTELYYTANKIMSQLFSSSPVYGNEDAFPMGSGHFILHLSSAENMEMQMLYRLAGIRAAI